MTRSLQGDTWDVISRRELGSTVYTEALINANRHLIETQIFRAGVELEVPDVERKVTMVLPPWSR